MLITIKRANNKDVGVYKEIFKENGFQCKSIDSLTGPEWMLRVKDIGELFRLAQALGHELILNGRFKNVITIYDDRLE